MKKDTGDIVGRAARRGGWGQRGTAGAAIAVGLAFEHIRHNYGPLPAVNDISLNVSPGEVICLLGPSGCGKTTLLRIAAGVERQTAGRVLMDGREVAGPTRFVPPEKRGIGLMFQDYALFPHLTILGNVAFGLTRLSRVEAEREARHALARVGLESYADDYPHVLSGGEQQRVALARAIAPRPGVLLMDEPFSGLDRRMRENLRDETMALLRETRATSIIVTHDPEEAMQIADRIALMRKGALVQLGTADELYTKPAGHFAARFFSDFNEFTGVVRNKRVDTPFGPVAAKGYANGTGVDILIRPQGLTVSRAGKGAEGRVLRWRFLGDTDVLEIAVSGLDTPVRARVPAGRMVTRGQDVRLRADQRHILLFPRGLAAESGG